MADKGDTNAVTPVSKGDRVSSEENASSDSENPVIKDSGKLVEVATSESGSRTPPPEEQPSFIEIYVSTHGSNLKAKQRSQIILTLLICGVSDLGELLEVDHDMLNDVCAQDENLSHMHKMRTRQFLERQASTHTGFERFAVQTPESDTSTLGAQGSRGLSSRPRNSGITFQPNSWPKGT